MSGSTKASPTPSIVPVSESEKLYNGVSTIPLWRLYLLVLALVLHFICNSGAIQSNNVAVGFIAQDLKFEELQIQWIQSAYQLSSGCLLLLFVPLCDRLGARSIAIFAAGFYTIWAMACANAQTPDQFIIFRALQGVGACAGIPAAFSILGQVLPVIEGSGFRALVLSIYSAGAPLGSGLGTIIGGLATQYSAIQWRGIYAAFAGINGLSCILLLITCPPSPTKIVPGGVDYSGAALITISLTLIIFCLSQGPAVGWHTSYVVALLVIGCVLLPVFVAYEIWLERKGSTPMLRMSNFARGRYLAMNALGLIGFASFVTWDYYVGLYYQQIKGQEAVQVMLRYMPQSLFAFLAAPAATCLLQHISTQLVFQFGALSAAMSGLIFAVSHVDDTYWNGAQFLSFALGITGACFVYCSGMLYSVSVVIPQEQSAAGGLFQVMTSLASAIGLVFSSIVANAHTSTEEPDKSFRYGFWVSVAYGLFAVVAAIPLLWGIGVLNKTGETARVEALVAHHHEKELFDKHAEQPVQV